MLRDLLVEDEPALGFAGTANSAASTGAKHIREQIRVLYSGDQCTETGLRFDDSNELHEHKDALFKKNAVTRGTKSRMWYVRLDAWIGQGSVDDDDVQPAGFFETASAENSDAEDNPDESLARIPADSVSSDSCAMCTERFETAWSDEHEGWDYVAAILNDAGQAVHVKCAGDAGDVDTSASDGGDTGVSAKKRRLQ